MWGAVALVVLAFVAGLLVPRPGVSSDNPARAVLPTAFPTATLRPTLTPTPFVTPTPDLFFPVVKLEDSLRTEQQSVLRAGRAERATYTFASGGYQISVPEAQTLAWSPLPDVYTDASVQVDAMLERGPRPTAYGLIARYQDDQNYLLFTLSGDGYYSVDRLREGRWQTLIDWTQDPRILTSGNQNTLRLDMGGERMRIYVNGELLDELTDDSFRNGRIALAVNTFEVGGAVARFANLRISERRNAQP